MIKILFWWMLVLNSLCEKDRAPVIFNQEIQRYEFSQPKMGTEFFIKFYTSNDSLATAAASAAFARIDELNEILSDYYSESEINRLSKKSGNGEFVQISNDLFQVLSISKELCESSESAFDITIGPLTKLWRRAVRQQELPAPDKIKEAKDRVGCSYLLLDYENKAAKLLISGMQLDVGGIGKGYALDEAMKVLKSFGIKCALIDGGGDILVSNPPPGKAGWEININKGNTFDTLNTTIIIKNKSIATSGDTFRFVELDGKRYSHIIDPFTGLGNMDQYLVSVIANDGATADGLASAISILGPEKGLSLIDRYHNASLVVVSKSQLWYSEDLKKYF